MNKLSELKEALEWIEGSQYSGEWDSALVAGAGENYHAVTNGDDVVVHATGDDAYSSLFCDYIVGVSPSNIRALLAELEAKDSEIEAANARVDVMCAKAMNLTERAESAEKRLATPVRLMGKMLLHDWEHSVERQAAFQHRKTAWDARMEEDKKAISAAGFTFIVEGDE